MKSSKKQVKTTHDHKNGVDPEQIYLLMDQDIADRNPDEEIIITASTADV